MGTESKEQSCEHSYYHSIGAERRICRYCMEPEHGAPTTSGVTEPKESDKPVGQLYVENLARMGADEETVERARQVAAQHPSATRVPTEPEVGNPWRPTYDKRQEMWNRFNEGTATKNDGMSLVYYCDALEAERDALRVSRDEWRETALHAIRGIDSIDRTIKEALNDR